MFFVVLGAGEVGTRVAQILSNEGHEVVIIEKNRTRVASIYNRIDCRVVVDEGTKLDALEEAQIGRADYFIAATNFDEVNLISSLLVHKTAPKTKIIARLREEEYLEHSRSTLFPIDHVVHPERAAALAIIRSIEFGGGASDVFTFKNFGNLIMRSYFVDSDSPFIDIQLKDLFSTLKFPEHIKKNFLIALVNRDEEAIIPTGDFEFKSGDEVFLVGQQSTLEDILQHIGKTLRAARHIRNIIILGASPVAEEIVAHYHNLSSKKLSSLIGKKRFGNKEITVIDDDLEKCNTFAEKYPEINVLHADITAEDVLEDLEIGQSDMLIATTALQERNIVLAAHSYNLGVPNTIALVRTPIYFQIASELGISMSLSIRSEVVSAIMGFLRGHENLYTLVEGSYGMFECKVDPSSAVVDKQINNIVLPEKSLILSTDNEKENVVTSGNTVIRANDTLLCISHPDSIEKLRKLFGIEEEVEDVAEDKK